MEHIQISHSREEETFRLDRLNIIKGYLSATLSPLELKIIKSLHDHKGLLTVELDKQLLESAVRLAGKEYEEYLKIRLAQAWKSQFEYEIEFEIV